MSLIAAVLLAAPVPVPGQFDYQLGGAYPPPPGVTIVTRDRRARPAAGKYSICYVNAFQTQPGARSWWRVRHPHLILRRASGRPVVDGAWGEFLLDTGTPAKRKALGKIVGRWIDGCATSGFDAVEPDNLDSWQRSRHLLTRKDNVAFARLLIRRAHRAGLAIAQKNAAGLAPRRLFDFAVTEECQRWSECGRFTSAYGNQVIEIEYRRRDFEAACRARAGRIPIVLRDLNLVTPAHRSYRYAAC